MPDGPTDPRRAPSLDFEALRVDAFPVDQELQDDGTVGPELAHLSGVYRRSPRALVWRNPSSEWRLFVLLVPLASRLSLMANPVFAQLTRAWGLSVRFVGVDRDALAWDFRALLSDRTLRLIVELLDADRSDEPALLDTLFAALAREMLTTLQRRGPDWGRHLDVGHRLEAQVPGTLFERETRFPDFLGLLRKALRDGIIDVAFYGRALRSIDLRETSFEQRAASLIESALDPVTMAKLAHTGAGRHLGSYNWLRIDPRHASARAHALSCLPGLATFFAESLLPIDALLATPETDLDAHADAMDELDANNEADDAAAAAAAAAAPGANANTTDPNNAGGPRSAARARRTARLPTFDLKALAARSDTQHSGRWALALRRAIDAGQDRAIIEAVAQRFAVSDNVIRRLWREAPPALGQPPTWHLGQILRRLHEAGDRDWPRGIVGWNALIASAVPAEAV